MVRNKENGSSEVIIQKGGSKLEVVESSSNE